MANKFRKFVCVFIFFIKTIYVHFIHVLFIHFDRPTCLSSTFLMYLTITILNLYERFKYKLLINNIVNIKPLVNLLFLNVNIRWSPLFHANNQILYILRGSHGDLVTFYAFNRTSKRSLVDNLVPTFFKLN